MRPCNLPRPILALALLLARALFCHCVACLTPLFSLTRSAQPAEASLYADVIGWYGCCSAGLYTNMFVTERQLKGVATAAFFYFCLAQLSHAIRDHQRTNN